MGSREHGPSQSPESDEAQAPWSRRLNRREALVLGGSLISGAAAIALFWQRRKEVLRFALEQHYGSAEWRPDQHQQWIQALEARIHQTDELRVRAIEMIGLTEPTIAYSNDYLPDIQDLQKQYNQLKQQLDAEPIEVREQALPLLEGSYHAARQQIERSYLQRLATSYRLFTPDRLARLVNELFTATKLEGQPVQRDEQVAMSWQTIAPISRFIEQNLDRQFAERFIKGLDAYQPTLRGEYRQALQTYSLNTASMESESQLVTADGFLTRHPHR